jgi:hypothetical protein
MKTKASILRLAALAALAAGCCPRSGATAGDASPDVVWQPGAPLELYVAPGRATTVLLHGKRKVAAISLASPIIAYKYDKALNQLEITPTVRAAGVETNLNLRIGPDVYILLVKVVDDVRAQALRSFVLSGDAGPDDEAGLAQALPLKPQDVDVVGAAKILEQAETDPVFRQAHPELRIEPLGQCYGWNDCLVELVDAVQFIDRDLLVFRVQWVNRTSDALYLDSSQYGLFVAGRTIPIVARYKVGVGAVVYPGQLETVYLAVQGYRLSRHNDWRLGLPPDGDAIARLMPR